MNPVDTNPLYFFAIHFSILPSTPRNSQAVLSFKFPHQNSICLLFLIVHAACTAHLILLDLFILKLAAKEYTIMKILTTQFSPKVWISSSASYSPNPPTVSAYVLPIVWDQVSHPYMKQRPQGNVSPCQKQEVNYFPLNSGYFGPTLWYSGQNSCFVFSKSALLIFVVAVYTICMLKLLSCWPGIYGHHTDWLHENCSKKMILAHFIVNRTILMF